MPFFLIIETVRADKAFKDNNSRFVAVDF